MESPKNENPCDRKPPSRISLIDRFEAYLKKRGHTDYTKQSYLSSAKHFYSWLGTTPWSVNEISRETAQYFLEEHLPVCCCPRPGYKDVKTVRAALNQVLSMDGYDRIRPFIRVTYPYIEAEIGHFDAYLQNTCGHAETTRWYHRRHIREFLGWLFGDQRVCIPRITAEHLCRFVMERSSSLRSNSISTLVYSLRKYLRFLQLNGYGTPSLEATIPRPPNWAGASLPQALNHEELNRFWSVFDLQTPVGKRDHAIARCLVDLGLRCHEVASIRLDSIDWHKGVLYLARTKSRRQETLPMPEKMGRALVAYLRNARPKTKNRFVFVYHRAPLGQAVQNTTVRGIIRRAFTRAGLPWSGTHILRSTAATRLLEGGASLKDVADVMRHRSIDTTKSYTRINFAQLAKVALPWPGRLP
ncbi:MAG: tyrosine-type recombinase/integrase [Deltaproteobacteria bacterium]|nr:tyrosine-type recombinase/integrase [Deltaproteobacteria bacterium]